MNGEKPLINRLPLSEPFDIRGKAYSAKEVIALIEPLLTDVRREKILKVITKRDFDALLVLDEIYDDGNINAVMRSSEAMGFSQMHIIKRKEAFKKSRRITQGADQWMQIRRWKDPQACLEHLKTQGYRLLATRLEDSQSIEKIDFSQPTALILGNEKNGVSPEVLAAVDGSVRLPMWGFVQSYNVSVAAALSLAHIRRWRDLRLQGQAALNNSDLNNSERKIDSDTTIDQPKTPFCSGTPDRPDKPDKHDTPGAPLLDSGAPFNSRDSGAPALFHSGSSAKDHTHELNLEMQKKRMELLTAWHYIKAMSW